MPWAQYWPLLHITAAQHSDNIVRDYLRRAGAYTDNPAHLPYCYAGAHTHTPAPATARPFFPTLHCRHTFDAITPFPHTAGFPHIRTRPIRPILPSSPFCTCMPSCFFRLPAILHDFSCI